MLKKILLLSAIFVLTFSACSVKKIRYSYDFKTIQQGINFTQSPGNWVLTTKDIPENEEVNILNQFNKWTKNKTVLTSEMVDKEGKLVGNLFASSVDKKGLQVLNKVSDYKYFVDAYLVDSGNTDARITIGEMMFDIYDISTQKLIVSERVIGSMDNENPDNIGDIYGFRFGVTPNMIKGLVKKGLKRIEKNSTY